MKFFFSFSPSSVTVYIQVQVQSITIVPGTVVRVASFDCHLIISSSHDEYSWVRRWHFKEHARALVRIVRALSSPSQPTRAHSSLYTPQGGR